jgi:class 3 adenylate cyclase/pimeloyl-ACP methyl ester carboxylesterase
MEPRIQYAKTSDGVNIAYAVFGSGPAIVFATGIWGNTHLYKSGITNWTFADRLISLGWSVITYDGRGTGSSEREPQAVDYTLDGRLKELEAVIDQAAPKVFVLGGVNQGGFTAIAYAAREPERITHLVLSNCAATGAEFYAVRPSWRMLRGSPTMTSDEWRFYTLSIANEQLTYRNSERAQQVADLMRSSTTPGHYFAAREATEQMDVRHLLAELRMPTLVVHDRYQGAEYAPTVRALAPLITGARYVETSDLAATIDEFLREGGLESASSGAEAPPSRRKAVAGGTAVILFADIANSTGLTEQLGDTGFRDRSRALDEALRALIRETGGKPVEGKLLGDGLMAVFTSAREAIECALRCSDASGATDLRLHLGVHAGDVIHEADNVYGGAVNIASRIAGASAPGEVLVSDIVRGLARTSADVTFLDRGERELKGLSDPVRLYEVRWRDAQAL